MQSRVFVCTSTCLLGGKGAWGWGWGCIASLCYSILTLSASSFLIYLFIYLFVHSIHLFICLFICSFIYLFSFLPVQLFLSLFIHASIPFFLYSSIPFPPPNLFFIYSIFNLLLGVRLSIMCTKVIGESGRIRVTAMKLTPAQTHETGHHILRLDRHCSHTHTHTHTHTHRHTCARTTQ